jgi:hypothetical protein
MQVNINKPSTVYIVFAPHMPRKFELSNENGELYYFRFLDGKTPRIKFNLLHAGTYTGNANFSVEKIADLEKPSPLSLPALPPHERERSKDFRIVYNPRLTGTPARIFTEIGLIEKGVSFYELCKPVRVFILLHELGHFYYKTEEYCDLYALVHYLNMGYNRSMAFYSLSRVLKKTPENLKRLKELHRNIEKTNSKKLF